MTLEQLRYFYAAATLSHIGRAAAHENISQPSLSIAIRKLEKELNVPLFQKVGRNVELTASGREFLPYVASVLQQLDTAKAQMAKQADAFHSEIRLAYTASVAYQYIPELFSGFLSAQKQRYLIYSDEMPSDEIEKGIREGRFDLGICSRLNDAPDMEQIPILYQPLVLIVPGDAADSSKQEDSGSVSVQGIRGFASDVDPDALISSPDGMRDIPFVSYRTDYPMFRQVSGILERYQVQPQIAHYAYSEDAIARLVEHHLGISIVAETDSLRLYRIRILRPSWLREGRNIFLTYHRLRYQGKAVQEMMEFVSSFKLPSKE